MANIIVLWKSTCPRGLVEVVRGSLLSIEANDGVCIISGNQFMFSSHGACRLELDVALSCFKTNDRRTYVIIREESNPFSFFVDDVTKEYPIYVPEYGVAVINAGDDRSFAEIEQYIQAKGLVSQAGRIFHEPEESYEKAAAVVKDIPCETWLGISRDIRIFGTGFFLKEYRFDATYEALDWVSPRFHSQPLKNGEKKDIAIVYRFLFGRGVSLSDTLTRRMEDGMLPILHACREDGGIKYHVTAFAALEKSRLCNENVKGTHYLVAESFSAGYVQTEEQSVRKNAIFAQETNHREEIVLFYRIDAENSSLTPRYAWFKAVEPNISSAPSNCKPDIDSSLDEKTGFGLFGDGSVFCISKLDGKPLHRLETTVLVPPGGHARLEFMVPHSPISQERAHLLALQAFDENHAECLSFWKQKLAAASEIEIPEKKINDMLHAGLLHLDMISYGKEPDGSIAPTVGIYSPIGSESAPIIQFMDSMGWHHTARRALSYFLDKQHEDGFMQNFEGYMLETGAVLWSMGEHYRYTRDDAWVASIKEKLLKSCQYLIDWSEKNKREELRGKGFGMMDGKVADPVDLDVRFYMLNGYSYLGLSRVSELLVNIDPAQSVYLAEKAQELKKHIRKAFFESMGEGPLVPISDGSWCPTVAPFAGYPGALCLYAAGRDAYTHGAFTARDGLLGPMYAVFQEVIEPSETAVDFMLKYYNEILFENNTAFTQPYYSVHPWVHLKRSEVELFLKNYYHCVCAMSDRETYTFREAASQFSSVNKTHEEGWFLMQTRWMLYMEEGGILRLLGGIPRAWMKDGQRIKANHAASYFGPLSFDIHSHVGQGTIKVLVMCASKYKPGVIEIRLPHPEGKKATGVSQGIYDAAAETVTIVDFSGSVDFILEF